MSIDPIIVVGPPRSGTSVIARLLQTELDYMMDEGPIRKDWRNPDGYYEDQRLIDINKIVLKNWQYAANMKMPMQWAGAFAIWLAERKSKYQKWGFKDPRIVGFVNWVNQFLDDPVWIVCKRSDKQIARSQIKKLGFEKQFVMHGLKAYWDMIDKHIDNPNVIDLSKYRPETELVVELRGIVNG